MWQKLKEKRKIRKSLCEITEKQKNKYDKGMTSQESIPFEWIDRFGLMKERDGVYNMSLEFFDRSFEGMSIADRDAAAGAFESLINSFRKELRYEFCYTCFKEKKDIKKTEFIYNDDMKSSFVSLKNDALLSENEGYIKHMYLVIEGSFKNRKEAMEKLFTVISDTSDKMRKSGIRSEILDGRKRTKALGMILRQREISLDENFKSITESGLSAKDFVAPMSFEFHGARSFKIEDREGVSGYVRIDSGSLERSDFGNILKLNIPRIITVHLRPMDSASALKLIKRKVSDLDAMAIDEEKKAVRNGYDMERIPRDLGSYGKDAQEMLERLQRKGERLFDTDIMMCIFGDTKDELLKNRAKAESALSSVGCNLAPYDFRQEEGLMSSLPLGNDVMETQRSFTTHSLTAFMPFISKSIRNMEKGALCGHNKYSGETILIDRTLLQNPNGLILGTPGAGKSFFAKWEMISSYYTSDDDIIICDPESEYHAVTKAFNGEVVKISPTSKNHINPMEIDIEGDIREEILVKGDFIQSMFEIIMGDENITAGEKSTLNHAVVAVYEKLEKSKGKAKMPTLHDLYDELLKTGKPEGRHLADGLEIYVKGSLDIFSHESNVNIRSRVIDFDIKDLGTGLKDLGMLIIENEIWERIVRNRRAGKMTRCYIDEMHLLLGRAETASFTSSVWKRARKYGGIPTGITQNVKDLLRSPEAATVIENSNYIVMLRQAPGDKDILMERLKISERMASELSIAGEGEGIIKCENDFIPFVNIIPNENMLYSLMTTKPGEGEICDG